MHPLLLLLFALPSNEASNYVFIITKEPSNTLIENAWNKSVEIGFSEGFLTTSESERIVFVSVDGINPTPSLDKLCLIYDKIINDKNGHVPVLLDTTYTDVPSEIVQAFTAALSIPTVSVSFGQKDSIRAWRNLNENIEKYQVQIMCPPDMLGQIVRSFVEYQNLTNAVILYEDPLFVMDHKMFALLESLSIRYDIKPLKNWPHLKTMLLTYTELAYRNFFFLGTSENFCNILVAAEKLKLFDNSSYEWVFISLDSFEPCELNKGSIFVVYPEPDKSSEEALMKLDVPKEQEIMSAFYVDLIVRMLLAFRNMISNENLLQPSDFVTCNNFKEQVVRNFDLMNELKKFKNRGNLYAPFHLDKNGHNYMRFKSIIELVKFYGGQEPSKQVIGSWMSDLRGPLQITAKDSMPIKGLTPTYRVVVALKSPFVMKNIINGKPVYYGLCIDLLNEIRKHTHPFKYTLYEIRGQNNGYLNENGTWDGIIGELIERKAEIGLTALSVLTEREAVIDFTMPFYRRVGITILMKKKQPPTSLFKFLTVLERDVWLCILGAYFLTSTLMWIFDRYSPYSYQNNKEKYKDDDEKRIFGFRESLWFCLTSLTPQGGGEAPKNLSGRLVAATWWLFGFIIIASYTANLAAFLTVSRFDTSINSIDDLAKQYKIQYGPVNGSLQMNYFKRMADIENRFYEIWKDMSLNDSLSPIERSKLAVWDYPVSDKFTRIWQAMKEITFPNNLQEAVNRVLQINSTEEFAFIGSATDIEYLYQTNCDLQKVGPEFSSTPYAIAVQTGSHLLEPFNVAIQQLMQERIIENLTEFWWQNVSTRHQCDILREELDGISIRNIGGVFIVIVIGILGAILTLVIEYFWYRYGKKSGKINNTKEAVEGVNSINYGDNIRTAWQPSFEIQRNLHRRKAARNLPPVWSH